MQSIVTEHQYREIAFFDGKIAIANSIVASLAILEDQTVEELLWHSFGETTAVYDSGLACWREKLANSRVRPPTVIKYLYGDNLVTIDGGQQVRGRDMRATVRTMPHSEWPSGSSSVCSSIEEYVTVAWPKLNLKSGPYTANTLLVATEAMLPEIPFAGIKNPAVNGYTAAQINQRCGETRQEGGMHFTDAVDAGKILAKGMGTTVGNAMVSMIPGLEEEGATIRTFIQSSPACTGTCDGLWDLPAWANGATDADVAAKIFQITLDEAS